MRTKYNTPHETFFIALFLTNCVVNRFTHQNQSLQNSLIPYVCLPNLCPLGEYGYRQHKGNTFALNLALFVRKNVF